MRRRLLLSFLAVVAITLAITAVGTLVVSQTKNRTTAEQNLRRQADGLAVSFGAALRTDIRNDRPARTTLIRIRDSLRLQDAATVLFTAEGRPLDGADVDLPSDFDFDALVRGTTISGDAGSSVYAAAPIGAGEFTLAIVLTDEVESIARPVLGWFLLSAAIAFGLAAAAAITLSRRFSQPLIEASDVTRRVAEGDLRARMTPPGSRGDDETAELVRSVNTMVDTLERSQGLERQFLLSVSHDLRTPMTSIQGYAEALTDGAIADPQQAGRVILSESKRLDRLVRDLLDLARLDAKRFSLDLRREELHNLVGAVVSGFQRDAVAADLSLSFHPCDTQLTVAVDGDRLAQVVANLIENATRYARSSVDVRLAAPGGSRSMAQITVSDDGPGIDPVDLPHIFERLYQAKHQPENRETGTGLGLAIAHELVTAMHGSLDAVASPAGATFVVSLPLADDA